MDQDINASRLIQSAIVATRASLHPQRALARRAAVAVLVRSAARVFVSVRLFGINDLESGSGGVWRASPGTGRLVCGTSDQGQIRPERVADDSPSSPRGGGALAFPPGTNGAGWLFPATPRRRCESSLEKLRPSRILGPPKLP